MPARAAAANPPPPSPWPGSPACPASVSGGSVRFNGEDVLQFSKQRLKDYRWREVSFVFQSAMNALNPVMRVYEQIADTILTHNPQLAEGEVRARAVEMFELVGIPPRRLDDYPHQFSGGMRQRICIAIALCLNPKLIIMDEPTTALDVVVQRDIIEQICELKERLGFSVLFITHDLGLMIEFCDRIGIMYAGELVEVAPRQQHPHRAAASLYQSPWQLLPAAHRTACPPRRHFRHAAQPQGPARRLPLRPALPARDGHLPRGRAHRSEPIRPGGRMSSAAMTAPGASGDVLIEMRDVDMDFALGGVLFGRAEIRALTGVSLQLIAGRALALVGESGSGKSTCARMLSRVYTPSGGSIHFRDRDLATLNGRELERYPRRRADGVPGSVRLAQSDPDHRLPSRAAAAVAQKTARQGARNRHRGPAQSRRPDPAERLHQAPSARAERRPAPARRIARALSVEPVVLLADEPTSMLDVSVRLGILNLLEDQKTARNLASLYITHDIATARYFAEDTAVLYAGHLVEQGPSEAITATPAHPYTQLLIEAVPTRRAACKAGASAAPSISRSGPDRALAAPSSPAARAPPPSARR